MRITRRFTEAGKDVYEDIEFRKTTSEIRNPDGSVVFRAENLEVPAVFGLRDLAEPIFVPPGTVESVGVDGHEDGRIAEGASCHGNTGKPLQILPRQITLLRSVLPEGFG